MLNHMVRRVHAFHVKHKCDIDEGQTPQTLLLRYHLIHEELGELLLAFYRKDQLAFVDGLGDLMYVCVGSEVAIHGVNEYPGVHAPIVPMSLWSESQLRVLLLRIENISRLLTDSYLDTIAVSHYSIMLCAAMGYDPLTVFDRIADSNDTKMASNDPRVKDKGPDFRPPVLQDLLR